MGFSITVVTKVKVNSRYSVNFIVLVHILLFPCSLVLMKMLALFYLIFFVAQSYAEVWDVRHQWSEDWNTKYRSWVASERLHRNIFRTTSNPVIGRLSTDCADALYALRVYFCYKNGLPFRMYSPEDYLSKTAEEFLE